jgi:hypothetical protein
MYGTGSSKDASELLQLKFSVYDSYEGTADLFKSLLVNCQPRVRNMYKVFETGLDRMARFELSEMVEDLDGDSLTFSISTSDQTKLDDYGFTFEAV